MYCPRLSYRLLQVSGATSYRARVSLGFAPSDLHGSPLVVTLALPPQAPPLQAQLILTVAGVRYDVTEWADSHPGGSAVLSPFAGCDATQAFDAIGHSARARELLERFRMRDDVSPIQAVGTALHE